ncbi:MAG: hypothetical protein CSB55_05525 [Candidatus Cloacimonadota bacterium]|nr:MAG: hypothetical protein CSB55_05525 [Candidatus Cloacimonadota bacterium]
MFLWNLKSKFVILSLSCFLLFAEDDFSGEDYEDAEHQTTLKSIYFVSSKELSAHEEVTDKEAKIISDYLKYRYPENWNKLKKIGVSPETVIFLKNYYTLEKNKKYNFNFLCRTSYKSENKKTKSSLPLLQKYSVSSKSISAGLVLEKDKSEKEIYEFTSYYGELKKDKFKINAGNYIINWGYGLVFAKPLGKPDFSSVKKMINPTNKISLHKSSFESGYLSGVSAGYNYENVTVNAFMSHTGKYYRLENGKITSLSDDGIHAENETPEVKENIAGVDLFFQSTYADIGISAATDNFSHSFNNPYLSKNNNLVSLIGTLKYDNLSCFGELANSNKISAFHIGTGFMTDSLKSVLSYRHFPAKYHSFHQNAIRFSQALHTEEKGILWKTETKLFNKIKLEYMLNTGYTRKKSSEFPFKKSRFNQKITVKSKIFALSVKQKKTGISNSRFSLRTRTYRLKHHIMPSKSLKITQNIQFKEEKSENKYKSGFLVYAQLEMHKKLYNFYVRLTAWDTKISLYEHENNLTGVLLNRIHNGSGSALVLLLKQNIRRNLKSEIYFRDCLDKKDQKEYAFQIIYNF